jgi:hypothetical protein
LLLSSSSFCLAQYLYLCWFLFWLTWFVAHFTKFTTMVYFCYIVVYIYTHTHTHTNTRKYIIDFICKNVNRNVKVFIFYLLFHWAYDICVFQRLTMWWVFWGYWGFSSGPPVW